MPRSSGEYFSLSRTQRPERSLSIFPAFARQGLVLYEIYLIFMSIFFNSKKKSDDTKWSKFLSRKNSTQDTKAVKENSETWSSPGPSLTGPETRSRYDSPVQLRSQRSRSQLPPGRTCELNQSRLGWEVRSVKIRDKVLAHHHHHHHHQHYGRIQLDNFIVIIFSYQIFFCRDKRRCYNVR